MISFGALSTLLLAGVVTAAPSWNINIQATSEEAKAAFAAKTAKKIAALRAAPSHLDMLKLLEDKDLVFDFKNPPTSDSIAIGAGGTAINGITRTFPALIGSGMAMAVGFMEPCAIDTPHTHPRATEMAFSVNTTLKAGMLAENGDGFHFVDIPAGSAMILPQGSIHFEMNPSCEPAMFVAGFNNEDPGTLQIAQHFFGLPPSIVDAAVGSVGPVKITELAYLIPDQPLAGLDECLARCGIKRDRQATSQQQPRVSGNAYPPGALQSATAALNAAGTGVLGTKATVAATSTGVISGPAASTPTPEATSRAQWKRDKYPQARVVPMV